MGGNHVEPNEDRIGRDGHRDVGNDLRNTRDCGRTKGGIIGWGPRYTHHDELALALRSQS